MRATTPFAGLSLLLSLFFTFIASPGVCVASTTTPGAIGDSVVNTAPKHHQSVGLVLSGGGAKGIAHIGVIKALEENDIPIDYIAGTSMGAIVGSLYAMGYTPEEMLELIKSKEFSYWSTGKIDPEYVYYFSREEPTPALVHIPVARKDSASAANSVPASIINPLPMNFGFMDVFAAYTAQCGGDFDKLFVPFRCVASDVEAGHKVVHSSGDLGDAVRTSMSFPIVFQPIRMNGALLYDGGIFDNFPVDVMEEDFAPDIMIGVDVSTPTKGPQTSIFDQVDNLVTKRQSYALPAEKGVKLKINLEQFGLLDFPKAQRIYAIGYKHAMEMMDSIKERITSRTPALAVRAARGAFKSATPYVRFDSLEVTGASAKQNRYIEYVFRPRHDADTFGIAHARSAFYRAVSPGRLRDLFPQAVYNPKTDLFTLKLRATPKDNFNIGLGGYITSSTSSYLFLSAGYKTLSFASMSANVNAWIGQSQMAGTLNTSINMATSVPSALGISAVVSRQRYFETDQLFFEDKMPSFIVSHEYSVRMNYTLAAGSRGKFNLGVGYGHLADSFFPSNMSVSHEVNRDHTYYNLGQLRAEYEGGTLNDIFFPTSGSFYKVTAMGVLGTMHFRGGDTDVSDFSESPRWLQLESRTRNYFSTSDHFSLGVESDIMLSTRKLTANYNASLVGAPSFNATPSTYNSFNTAFRANSFVAASLIPIYKYDNNLSARLNLSAFLPVRSIVDNGDGTPRYGDWFSSPKFFGELDVCYTLPFATLSAYANYVSAGSRPWNFGISIGIFIMPPRFLR